MAPGTAALAPGVAAPAKVVRFKPKSKVAPMGKSGHSKAAPTAAHGPHVATGTDDAHGSFEEF